MKVLRNISFVLLSLVMLSCHDWLDINEDPNNPSEVEYQKVLPAGITSVVYVMGGRYQVLGALWSQHWTQSLGASQYAGVDSYDINSSSFEGQWTELYAGALKAFEHVRQESAADEQWNYYLIATVMQAYAFQVLVDLYDQIPFSEALDGENTNLTPKYESGQQVYDSLIVRIDEALAKDFDADNLLEPEEEDFIFNGDINRWKDFANTLKLKIYLRQSEARPNVARQGIEALYADEVDFLEQDAAFLYFSNESGQRNPLYETEMNTFGGNPNLVLSNTLHSFLVENDDESRLNTLFYRPSVGSGQHKALLQGNYNDPDEPAGTSSSSYSKPIMLANYPVYLMSYTEANLLQAEAMIRYQVGDYSDAKEKYDDATRSAYWRVLQLEYAELTTEVMALIDGQINGEHYRFPAEGSPQETFVEAIITQKWVSLAGIQSLETFFEQNRTHYPRISPVGGEHADYEAGEYTVSVNNVTSGRFPKRLLFPKSEEATNPNTPTQNAVWEKVWWDVKAE